MVDRVPVTILGIDHVQVAAPRGCEAEARAFYGGLLGLEELAKPEALAARGGCWFRAGSQELHVGVEEPFAPARKAHPGLVVDDLAALDSPSPRRRHRRHPGRDDPGRRASLRRRPVRQPPRTPPSLNRPCLFAASRRPGTPVSDTGRVQSAVRRVQGKRSSTLQSRHARVAHCVATPEVCFSGLAGRAGGYVARRGGRCEVDEAGGERRRPACYK